MDKKEIKKTGEESLIGEREIKFSEETAKNAEKKEDIAKTEKIVTDQLRKEIEAMEMDENLKEEAKRKAEKIDFLGEKEKIERLLEIAREKGVIFAVGVAKDMKDPFLLDIFHDTLAQEGFYKKFMK